MVVSESTLKWIMRFYPPLFFQRIWVVKFDPGFKGVHVRVKKSFFNRNYNRSIFGGTIFSAADPFYPVLFYQVLAAKGYDPIVWLKSCDIQYLKPGRTQLEFKLALTDQVIAEAEEQLKTAGKHVKAYPVEILNTAGELCVSMLCEVYIRDRNFKDNSTITP